MRLKQAAILAALACTSIFALAACDSGTGIPNTPMVPIVPTVPAATPTVIDAATLTPIVEVNLPTPGPSATATVDPYQPVINITRKDYDDAIAKWRALDVREYEVIANFGSAYSDVNGDWRLLVRDGIIVQIWRGDVEVFIDDGSRSIPNPEANPGTLGFLTIDSQFRDIKELFDDPSKMYMEIGGDKFEMEFDIEFNDEFGYPEYFYSNPIRITDNSEARRIRQFRIIEQGPNATVLVTPGPALPTNTPRATSTSRVPEPTGTTTVDNPTQEVIIASGSTDALTDYSEALTKWYGSGVLEYEIKARVAGEGVEQFYELNVKNGKVTVISSSEGEAVTEDDYGIILPDKQFMMMAEVIAGNDDTGVELEGQKFRITYAVQFDPKLGYPTRFEMRVVPGPALDMGYAVIVDEFKVIK